MTTSRNRCFLYPKIEHDFDVWDVVDSKDMVFDVLVGKSDSKVEVSLLWALRLDFKVGFSIDVPFQNEMVMEMDVSAVGKVRSIGAMNHVCHTCGFRTLCKSIWNLRGCALKVSTELPISCGAGAESVRGSARLDSRSCLRSVSYGQPL